MAVRGLTMKLPARVARWIASTYSSLTRTFRAGFLLLAAGGVADVVYHAVNGWNSAHDHHAGLTVPTAIHLIVAAGMLVTLAGLLHAGVRSVRRSDHTEEAV